MLHNLLEKVKPFYNLILVLVIASIFFALGRISALEGNRTPIKIEYPNANQSASVIQASSPRATLGEDQITPMSSVGGSVVEVSGEVVASKNGTKYYFPWCGSAKNIKPENMVKFVSVELARKAGYTAAANCKGLK